MDDVRGRFLGLPHGTTPAAVTTNKNIKMSSFKSSENIQKNFKYKACDIFVRGVSLMLFFANAGMIKKTPDLISWLIYFAIASISKKLDTQVVRVRLEPP